VQIDEHRSELGGWRTARRRVAPPLRSFVRDILGSQSELPRALRERHVPSLTVALVINFGAPHRLAERASPDAKSGLSAWVVGLQRGHWLSEAVGQREFMVAQLTPIGAHLLLRLRMDLIADRIVELDEIDARFARGLVARIGRARDWAGRFDALEDVIAERLADQTLPAFASRALDRVVGGGGDVSLASLASELGCSHRHLIAEFRQRVGLPPKRIARLLRLGRALETINREVRAGDPEGQPYIEREATEAHRCHDSVVNWADLALSCGYYDQSHFIREFRDFTGWSPSQFQAAVHPGLAA
jgi:AraC-like DNA-binding protein